MLGRYSSAIRAACANERSCGSARGAISNGRPYRDLKMLGAGVLSVTACLQQLSHLCRQNRHEQFQFSTGFALIKGLFEGVRCDVREDFL